MPDAAPTPSPDAPAAAPPAQPEAAAPAETPAATAPATLPRPPRLFETPPQPELLGALVRKKLDSLPDKATDADREDAAALKAFYETRKDEPLWIAGRCHRRRSASAAIAEIKRADDWGLEAKAFELPSTAEGTALTREAAADTEMKLSLAVLEYARHARGGRVTDPSKQLSSYLDRMPQLLDPKVVLEQIAASAEPDATLRHFHPQHPQFEKLRQRYLELKHSADAAQAIVKVPKGPKLVPGQKQANVALLRKRLGTPLPAATGDAPVDETFYDDALAVAVKAFQKEKGLEARRHRLRGDAQCVERRRDAEPGEDPGQHGRVALDAAGSRQLLRHREHSRIHDPRRQGRPDHPRGARRHRLPGQTNAGVLGRHGARDRPSALDRSRVDQGARALSEPRRRRAAISSARGCASPRTAARSILMSVDWSTTDIRKFDIYQPSGPRNALGVVKLSFPNKHIVYFHDTPSKGLFNEASRAFSHGCIRVRNPVKLAAVVLNQDKGWDEAQVQSMVDSGRG